MASGKSNWEQRKKIFALVLFGALAFTIVYQLFLKTPEPRTRSRAAANANSNTSATASAPTTAAQPSTRPAAPLRPGSSAEREAQFQLLLADTTPLNLAVLSTRAGSAAVNKERGNIFAYYVEPPKPPPPPPPPPPITLQVLSPQSAVAGTPRNVTITVTGTGYPPDAEIRFDGQPRPTKRLTENSLSTELQAAEYSYQKNINVEVRSKSEPAKFWSAPLAFIVQPAPEPQFKYIGRIGPEAIIELPSKEIKRYARGATILGQWRVDAISDQAVDLTLTQYDIKKRINLQDKGR